MATEMTCRPAAPNEGVVIAFPSGTGTGTANIERCARELGRRHGADAIAFWRAECRRLADQLLAAGMSENDVGERVLQFQQDVQIELVLSHQNGPVPKSQNR
ncbi:hypothetical protein ATY75_19230 [Rhizobium sp. N122]|uniref:DUF6074 family protein n=1 Tax=Rhizobium sp. N122 TaxID=1764272 RepID=UPI000B5A8D6F|nr:DUF6074 family protein [Rhizobium sp. N122]OWV88757.1 hypothetical protein ATY75_19230 [Rhizobium sp. N122]